MTFRDLTACLYTDFDPDGYLVAQHDSDGPPGKRGEVAPFQLHHSYGFVARPHDPDVDSDKQPVPGKACSIWTESIGDETHGHLGVDPRCVPNTPKVSKGGSAQYGGPIATPTFTNIDGEDGTWTTYVPVFGHAGRAHVISAGLDANGKEYVGFVHSNGMSVTMLEHSLVLKSDTGAAYIEIKGGDIILSGNVRAAGGIVTGTDAALPLVTYPGLMSLLTALVSAASGSYMPIPGVAPPPIVAVLTSPVALAASTTLTKGT